ncbi:MAG: DUF697 domain-containing protein [Candidatus Electrothrix sp. AR5]|nr:DUF697 domain-containing protein [Candidatus Electrothrix sp. AR5]
MVERKKTPAAAAKKTPETAEEKAPEAGAEETQVAAAEKTSEAGEVKQECDMDSGADSCDGSGATSDSIIKKHIIFSMGVGVIPVPLLDMVAITGVQLNMLRKLAEIYEVPFNDHKVKSTLSSLVGGGVTVPVARTLLSLTKMIPVAGQVIGFVTMPITAGATTFAVGKVFNQHFASGGTFLTFDSEKVRGYYTSMFEKGKDVATEMKDAAKDAATEMKDVAKDAATEMKD